MSHPRRNIELKARYADLDRGRSIARSIGASFEGVLRQTDTYFHVPNGRLKLREIESAGSELIWYHRPNSTEARSSDYTIFPVSDVGTFKPVLTGALGVWCIVRKSRDLFLWKNVRIHLDQVEGLGSFIEFEAVLSAESSVAQEFERIEYLKDRFAIDETHLVAESYSDLLCKVS